MSDLRSALAEVESKAKALDDIDGHYEDDPTKAYSEDDQKKHDELRGQLREAQTIARRIKDREDTRTEVKGILGDLSAAQRPTMPAGAKKDSEPERRTLGQQFLESPEFQSWFKEVAPNGVLSDSMKGLNSPPVQFKADLITSGSASTDAGVFVIPDRKGTVALPFAPIDILDLITLGTTGSDTVEYPRITSMTSNVASVAQATDETDTSGIKPSSTMAFAKITTAVKTLAHWIPATKRAISDAGQLRTLIDSFLREGLRQEVADQIINGTGAGEDFTGLLAVTGTTTQAFATNLLTSTRKALTTCRVTALVDPTGFLFSPATWEKIDLTQDAEDRYYFGGPMALGNTRLWGLPVAQENKMPDAKYITGNLKQAVLWNREQSSIQVSDSHADFFIRNLVAILAETRAAFGVFRPAAIVIGATA